MKYQAYLIVYTLIRLKKNYVFQSPNKNIHLKINKKIIQKQEKKLIKINQNIMKQ